MAMEFSEAVDFAGCKEDEVQGPSGMLQCNFILCSSLSCKRGSILMKYDPFLKKKTLTTLVPDHKAILENWKTLITNFFNL